jgi:hypothetical protein
MKKIYVLFSFLILGCISWSQTKNEQEVRVKLESLPEAAIAVVNTLPNNCRRLRFYKESDGRKQSFEVKFKYHRKHYSIEFSTEGVIEDIELIVKQRQLENKIKSQIEAYFNLNYEKSKLIKIQKQYLYKGSINPTTFVRNLLSDASDQDVNYEIIAEVKSDSKREVGEFLFNENGELISFKTVNPNSYQHVLY